MKPILLTFLLMMLATCVKAQTGKTANVRMDSLRTGTHRFGTFRADSLRHSRPADWEDVMDRLGQSEDIDNGNLELMYDDLSDIANDRINLNTCTRADLEQLPFLTDEQVTDILSYRSRVGTIGTFTELALIPSLDVQLIAILRAFHSRYPWLHVILEPGSAFGWQTGPLVSQVVDVVENHGIRTAILDVSFTCHMPDCLEMPYQPAVRFAKAVGSESLDAPYVYRLGGNSCLSGDFMGYWQFGHELQVGENVIFEDMLHYTTVKTTMFNGISHPAIALAHADGELEVLREYSYNDYKSRMD